MVTFVCFSFQFVGSFACRSGLCFVVRPWTFQCYSGRLLEFLLSSIFFLHVFTWILCQWNAVAAMSLHRCRKVIIHSLKPGDFASAEMPCVQVAIFLPRCLLVGGTPAGLVMSCVSWARWSEAQCESSEVQPECQCRDVAQAFSEWKFPRKQQMPQGFPISFVQVRESGAVGFFQWNGGWLWMVTAASVYRLSSTFSDLVYLSFVTFVVHFRW